MMLIQFKTLDDAVWLVDTVEGKWAHVSKPPKPGLPEGDDSEILESGKLAPQGYGVYALEGRTSKSPAPGAGLCSVGMMPVAMGTVLHLYVRANVPVRDFTMPRPISTILYEVIPMPGGDDGQQQQGAEEPQGAQESAQPGAVPEGEAGGELPPSEAGVGLGEQEVAQPVNLQGAIAGEIPPTD